MFSENGRIERQGDPEAAGHHTDANEAGNLETAGESESVENWLISLLEGRGGDRIEDKRA